MRGSRRGSLMVCVAILTYQRKGKSSDWTGAGTNEDAAVRTDAMLRSLHFFCPAGARCVRILRLRLRLRMRMRPAVC